MSNVEELRLEPADRRVHWLWPLRRTLVLAALVTFVIAQPHAGFMTVLLVLPLAPWLLYSGFVMVTRPAARTVQAQKMAIWTLAVVVIVSVHYVRHAAARRYAQSVVDSINAYARAHGSYPDRLEAIGMTRAQLQSELGHSAYFSDPGRTVLFYHSTYVPFDQETYDFSLQSWRHIND